MAVRIITDEENRLDNLESWNRELAQQIEAAEQRIREQETRINDLTIWLSCVARDMLDRTQGVR